MSVEVASLEVDHKYIYAIIRKPQEGKTFICLEQINQNKETLHIIVTMNTIKSNLQFFERASQKFGDKICVFNSKSPKSTVYKHAKDVIEVLKEIDSGCDIIIMCSHYKRYNTSISDLLSLLSDSCKFKKNINIHIDEAHEYIPKYRDKIIEMNNNSIVERLFMYSATPFSIWMNPYECDKYDLFKKVYIVDVEDQYGIIKSDKYYGVKDCEFISTLEFRSMGLAETFMNNVINKWGTSKNKEALEILGKGFYQDNYPFSLGNEIELLSHVETVLCNLYYKKLILNDKFSYNFVPGYIRKLTHYAIMEIIIKIYSRAIVIIINGDGTNGYMYNPIGKEPIMLPLEHYNEPSEQIYNFIKDYKDRPVFITGFHCVGMSVTFINEKLGNFHNVLLTHNQFINQPSILYQLCRFVFNYKSWMDTTNICNTNIYSNIRATYDTCIKYEKQIEVINDTMCGSLRSLDEVVGEIPVKAKKIPKERKHSPLEKYAKVLCNKRFIVDEEDNPEEILDKLRVAFRNFMGKELKGKSMPSKNKEGLYECSTTAKCEVHYNPHKIESWAKKCKWYSNYQLVHGKYRYARVYIAYEEPGNPNEYTWILRRMEITNCEEVNDIWDKIKKAENDE